MRTIILTVFALMFCGWSIGNVAAQDAPEEYDHVAKRYKIRTTQEEYNYLTKGYKIQIESGLDMKKGYSFAELGTWGLDKGTEVRRCTFKALIRDGQTRPCAILMIYKRTDISNGAEFYVCIPSPHSPAEIWNQTLAFINENFHDNDTMLQTVIWALMKLNAEEAAD